MPRVVYTGNAGEYRLTQSGVTAVQGEPVDVDDDTAEYLLARDDFVEAEDAYTTDEEADDAVSEPPVDPERYTVSELEAAIDDGEFSEAELEAIRAAEASGENRKGVRGAIDARLEE